MAEQFAGSYAGSGTWHDVAGRSGKYRVQHRHAVSANGFDVSFTHDFDDGQRVDAHFTMQWVAPTLFSVHIAGAQVGNGYVFDDFCQYHLKIGEKYIQVGYRAIADELQVFGSSSTNAEGRYTAWTERLRKTSP